MCPGYLGWRGSGWVCPGLQCLFLLGIKCLSSHWGLELPSEVPWGFAWFVTVLSGFAVRRGGGGDLRVVRVTVLGVGFLGSFTARFQEEYMVFMLSSSGSGVARCWSACRPCEAWLTPAPATHSSEIPRGCSLCVLITETPQSPRGLEHGGSS